jgi:hypothetical protein
MKGSIPSLALGGEDDPLQREFFCDLSAKREPRRDPMRERRSSGTHRRRSGPDLTLLVTNAALAGRGTGLGLAQFAKRKFPSLNVILFRPRWFDTAGRRPLFQEAFCDRGIGAGRHGRAEVRSPAWGLEGGAAQATHFIAAALPLRPFPGDRNGA